MPQSVKSYLLGPVVRIADIVLVVDAALRIVVVIGPVEATLVGPRESERPAKVEVVVASTVGPLQVVSGQRQPHQAEQDYCLSEYRQQKFIKPCG